MKRKMKGLAGPRSGRGISAGKQAGSSAEPIELPDLDVEEEELESPIVGDPLHPSPGRAVDQRKPRRVKCRRCYGGGSIPSTAGDARGIDCPDCEGTGKIELETEYLERQHIRPIGFSLPRPADEPDRRIDPAEEILQTLEPGDIDYAGSEAEKADRLRRIPGQRRTRRSKPKKRRKPPGDDIPPWEKLDAGDESPF